MKPLYFFVFLAVISLNVNAQITYVPDDNFEQALIDLGYDSGALNNFVPTANINTIFYLDIRNKGISDLTGIEDFTAMGILDVAYNNLSNLNLNNNLSLTNLVCHNNNLESLDVSNNVNLEILYCYSNNLTSLDLSANTALKLLSCSSNSLTRLNLTNNSLLESLNCASNELVGINLKNGNNTIITFFGAFSNPNLACIQVEDEAYSSTNWTNTDPVSSFSEDCDYNGTTYVPDDNFEQALIDSGYDSGPLDDYIPTINIKTVSVLFLNNKNISDLTGIEDFTALEMLEVSSNDLEEIDVRQNLALTNLYCHYNNLTRLNLVNNEALRILNCSHNELRALNIKNGKNAEVTVFAADYNPDLECIQVDDPAYSEANWTNIDPVSSFRRNCQYKLNYSRQELTDFINEPFNNENLSIFPNPVKEVLTISAKMNGQYSIVDIKGQVLIKGSIISGNTEINLSQLEQGMYFFNVTSETDSISKKIIKN